MATQKTYLVLSALGEDRPGIVSQLSKVLLEAGCNIEDSRMAVLGGEFAVMLLVEGKWNTLAKVENSLPELGRQLGMTIISKRTGTAGRGRQPAALRGGCRLHGPSWHRQQPGRVLLRPRDQHRGHGRPAATPLPTPGPPCSRST